MESATTDETDRALAHALQLDGRASFSKIAAVLGVSEQTVARRYRRLRTAGALRVVAGVDGELLGFDAWSIRVRCTPDAATAIGTALARRADTYWVHLLSGGTEISCFTQSESAAQSDALLLDKLPRTTRVLGVTAQTLLAGFAVPTAWAGLAVLSDDQVAQLTPPPPDSTPEGPVTVTPHDRELLDALAENGRASYAELAVAVGWSESTVRRRLELLRRTGVLRCQLDFDPVAFGFRSETRLWLSVRPAELTKVAETLASHDEVSFVAATTGSTNLMANVSCRDRRAFFRYLTDRVSSLTGVREIETAPVLRTLKRTGRPIHLSRT